MPTAPSYPYRASTPLRLEVALRNTLSSLIPGSERVDLPTLVRTHAAMQRERCAALEETGPEDLAEEFFNSYPRSASVATRTVELLGAEERIRDAYRERTELQEELGVSDSRARCHNATLISELLAEREYTLRHVLADLYDDLLPGLSARSVISNASEAYVLALQAAIVCLHQLRVFESIECRNPDSFWTTAPAGPLVEKARLSQAILCYLEDQLEDRRHAWFRGNRVLFAEKTRLFAPLLEDFLAAVEEPVDDDRPSPKRRDAHAIEEDDEPEEPVEPAQNAAEVIKRVEVWRECIGTDKEFASSSSSSSRPAKRARDEEESDVKHDGEQVLCKRRGMSGLVSCC